MDEANLISYVSNITGLRGHANEQLIKEAMNIAIADVFSREGVPFRNGTSGFTTTTSEYYELDSDVEKVTAAYYTKSGKHTPMTEVSNEQINRMFSFRDLDASNTNTYFFSIYEFDDGATKSMRCLYNFVAGYRVSYEYQRKYDATVGVASLPERWHHVIVAGTLAAVKEGTPAGNSKYEITFENQLKTDLTQGTKPTRWRDAGYGVSGDSVIGRKSTWPPNE